MCQLEEELEPSEVAVLVSKVRTVMHVPYNNATRAEQWLSLLFKGTLRDKGNFHLWLTYEIHVID